LEIFGLNTRFLTYGQLQQAGAVLLNALKDIALTFLVAKLVIKGELTFGAMLAIQYIIGQLTGPIEQFIGFAQSAQEAKISMERLNEIHQMEDEEADSSVYIRRLSADKSISITNLSFSYPGEVVEPVLKHIDLEIPEGQTTAIVGLSGSGKTTLLRLLLKFYDSYNGNIMVGDANLRKISPIYWRKQCAAVLQDGFIFNDTILGNICLSYGAPNWEKLAEACRMSNILTFIEGLPNRFNSKLGVDGIGISQGQKQRLLIARALYKDSDYLFFDESTNALDADNEKAIVENLDKIFARKTVLIVAHRLSTIRNADRIVMLDQGQVIEEGDHQRLFHLKGRYFELMKNQLELGG
jgi:ATP-binding cassette subfamily B protein